MYLKDLEVSVAKFDCDIPYLFAGELGSCYATNSTCKTGLTMSNMTNHAYICVSECEGIMLNETW